MFDHISSLTKPPYDDRSFTLVSAYLEFQSAPPLSLIFYIALRMAGRDMNCPLMPKNAVVFARLCRGNDNIEFQMTGISPLSGERGHAASIQDIIALKNRRFHLVESSVLDGNCMNAKTLQGYRLTLAP